MAFTRLRARQHGGNLRYPLGLLQAAVPYVTDWRCLDYIEHR